VNHDYYRITRIVTPADSLDLVTLDQAKDALGIPATDTSKDAQIQQHITSTSNAINNWCDRIFAVQTYRDQVRNACGDWGEPVVTRQYPFVLDDSGVPLVVVTEDSVALDATTLETDTDTGRLYRLDGAGSLASWASTLLVVDYTAGFNPIPPDVQSACLEWVMIRYHTMGRDPTLQSETIPDLISQTYSGYNASGASAVPPSVRDWLMPYKVWTV
jgi:hypothetical protein